MSIILGESMAIEESIHQLVFNIRILSSRSNKQRIRNLAKVWLLVLKNYILVLLQKSMELCAINP